MVIADASGVVVVVADAVADADADADVVANDGDE